MLLCVSFVIVGFMSMQNCQISVTLEESFMAVKRLNVDYANLVNFATY